jgi:hypothetical protein
MRIGGGLAPDGAEAKALRFVEATRLSLCRFSKKSSPSSAPFSVSETSASAWARVKSAVSNGDGAGCDTGANLTIGDGAFTPR